MRAFLRVAKSKLDPQRYSIKIVTKIEVREQ